MRPRRAVQQPSWRAITTCWIFSRSSSTGDWYDEQLRAELERTDDTREGFFALAVEDVKRACDLLRPVWERTDGVDGFVVPARDPVAVAERLRRLATAPGLRASMGANARVLADSAGANETEM